MDTNQTSIIIPVLNENQRRLKYFEKNLPFLLEDINKFNIKYNINNFSILLYHYYNNIEFPCVCKICGKELKFISFNKGYNKYCSKKCANKARSIYFSGENHPQWTGGPKEYCVKFNKDLKNRIVAFWFENNNNICPLCEKPLDNKTPHCHHAYYDKKACCLVSEDGKYFSNLGIKNGEKSFEIIGDPNKFAPLHQRCHLRTNSKPKRTSYARKFETIINDKFEGKSYFTKEEYAKFLIRHPEWIPPYK